MEVKLMSEYGGNGYKPKWSLFTMYAQCYFISIATILGTGILGLPVSMAKSGFYPFLLTFTIGYIMQVMMVYSYVEVLQYCKIILSHNHHKSLPDTDGSSELLLLRDRDQKESENVLFEICETSDETGNKPEPDLDEYKDEKYEPFEDDEESTSQVTEPNLHMMGKLFLHRCFMPVFILMMFLHFVSILISYSLAGSEAWGQILNVHYIRLIPVFTLALTLIVIVARQIIQPVIALLTVIKGTLFFTTILVALYVGAQANNEIKNAWEYIDGPLLMGTVALGGMQMVMPMLFEKFDAVKDQIRGFRNSIVAGLSTCFVLNVLWSWAVISIVPQLREMCLSTVDGAIQSLPSNNTSLVSTLATITSGYAVQPASTDEQICDPEWTLEAAGEKGEITTVPLTQIILTEYPTLQWIALIIQLFILISITVSFLTIGSAMQHTVVGWVDDIASKRENCLFSKGCCYFWSRNWFWHYISGFLLFMVVLAVAMSNPKGFVEILEKVASFCLNAMAGPIVFLMIEGARSKYSNHVRIPLPTGSWWKYRHYVFGAFFTLAMIYDVMIWIIETTTGKKW